MSAGKRFKIACVGAGNVGASAAQYCAEMDLGDIVITDIVEGLPQGKALDLTEAGPIRGYSTVLTGSNDYRDIEGSDVVVVTAGLARKPGMTRLDLLEKNGKIIAGICDSIKEHAPNSVVIIVTNPLDVMVYIAFKKLGFPPERVIGMAGCLDSARMRSFVAMELGVSMKNVDTMVLGSHGDDMVPLPHYTTVSGIPITRYCLKTVWTPSSNGPAKAAGKLSPCSRPAARTTPPAPVSRVWSRVSSVTKSNCYPARPTSPASTG